MPSFNIQGTFRVKVPGVCECLIFSKSVFARVNIFSTIITRTHSNKPIYCDGDGQKTYVKVIDKLYGIVHYRRKWYEP